MGIAAGAEANRVAVEAMIKARNEGRDFYKEGPDILKKVASRNRALDVALAARGDITFNYESTDPGRCPNAHPRLNHTEEQSMRITQGTFSYLPDFSDEEITAQISYALENGWPLSVEFTDDPHPRNTYWEMWDLPMFDLKDAAGVLFEVNACRSAYPNAYIRLNAYDASLGRQTTAFSAPRRRTGFPP